MVAFYLFGTRRKKTVEVRREDKQKELKFYGKPSF